LVSPSTNDAQSLRSLACLDSVDGTSPQTTIVLGGELQSREGHIVNGVMYDVVRHDLVDHRQITPVDRLLVPFGDSIAVSGLYPL